MIFQPIDVALFLISFAACAYCMVLSRRLKSLQDTKDGLGATIAACTESISSMSMATRSTTLQARQLATELSDLLLRADTACERVERDTLMMQKKHNRAAAEIENTQAEVEVIMRDVLDQHKKHVAEIVDIIKQTHQLSARAKRHIQQPPQGNISNLVDITKRKTGSL